MKKQHSFSPPPVGGCSLLVIFAVLTLNVFALLGLSTVQAEQRLAQASAQAVSDYYAADLQAEQLFSRLRSGEIPPQVQHKDGTYRYACPITQQQTLMVELQFSADEWQVLRWQAVTLPQGSTADELLNVWDGSAP